MARFVIPVTIELHFETDTIDEAKERFYKWRKFVMAALHGRLAEIGVFRLSIPPVREVMEVDAAWLENRALRTKFRREWEYEEHQLPVILPSNAHQCGHTGSPSAPSLPPISSET